MPGKHVENTANVWFLHLENIRYRDPFPYVIFIQMKSTLLLYKYVGDILAMALQ